MIKKLNQFVQICWDEKSLIITLVLEDKKCYTFC